MLHLIAALLLSIQIQSSSLYCGADIAPVMPQTAPVVIRSAPSISAPIVRWEQTFVWYYPECQVVARGYVFYAVRYKGVRQWLQQPITIAFP